MVVVERMENINSDEYSPETKVMEMMGITFVYGPEEGGESQVESLKI